GRELVEPGATEPALAGDGLEGVARATGARLAAVVQVGPEGLADALHEWRADGLSAWGAEPLPWPPVGTAGHWWGGDLARQLAVAGVSVVPLGSAGGAARWALLLGWADRSRIWDEGWAPLLTAVGALLVGAERLTVAEARPAVD